MEMNSPHEKAVKAIVYGHSCAMRLKLRLENPTADDGSISNYVLAQSIVDCFSDAISFLSDTPKSEDDQLSDQSSRGSPPPKKRKMNITNSSESWRDDSPDPIYSDGFPWRKYGQKTIKKSHHQRSYYRCSYSNDHHCEARKHQQKIKDNPPLYRTTYFGHHTCVKEPVNDDMESAGMIHFGKKLNKDSENYLGTSLSLSVKQEDVIKQEIMDQSCEKTGNDQDYDQEVIEENQSSTLSFSGSESFEFDTDLLVQNLDLWDQLFDFGLC